MIAHHMFDNCDIALSWHPSDINMVHDQAYLANTSMKFYFPEKLLMLLLLQKEAEVP